MSSHDERHRRSANARRLPASEEQAEPFGSAPAEDDNEATDYVTIKQTRQYWEQRSAHQTPDPELAAAYERFYRRYDPLIRHYIGRTFVSPSDVDDLAQDCRAEVLLALCRFNPLPKLGQFRAWLMGVVYLTVAHVQRSRLRRERRVRLANDPSELEVISCDPPVGSESDTDPLRERLERVLNSLHPPLSPTTRRVLVLRLLEGHGVQDVARETGLNSTQVRNHQHDGLERLRRTLSFYADSE